MLIMHNICHELCALVKLDIALVYMVFPVFKRVRGKHSRYSHSATQKLPTFTPFLVHGDQMGFIDGRNIVEHVMFVAYLIKSCHGRKEQPMVIKLDF